MIFLEKHGEITLGHCETHYCKQDDGQNTRKKWKSNHAKPSLLGSGAILGLRVLDGHSIITMFVIKVMIPKQENMLET